MTYFCYKCSAKSLEQITLPEYIKGLTAFGINSWDEIKALYYFTNIELTLVEII